METYYAHPMDVLRKFNPQLTEASLDQDDLIGGPGDREQVLARLEGVESDFEALTGNPQRMVRVGEPTRPETWEVHGASLYRHQGGTKIWLDEGHVAPIDPDEGDAVHLRTGRDTWRDITDEAKRWDVNSRKGYIRVYSRVRHRVWRNAIKDEALRITYRHGAPGGRRGEPGETRTTAETSVGDSTVQVGDETMLPRRGVVKLGDEYVRVSSRGEGSVDVARGVRGTTEKQHDEGAVAHYCEVSIREAVAAKTALELLSYADWINELVDADGMRTSDKREIWEQEWEKTLSKFSEVRSY